MQFRWIYVMLCMLLWAGCGNQEKRTSVSRVENDSLITGKLIAKLRQQTVLTARVDSFFRQARKKKRFNGTVLFAREGEVIYKQAFGYRNLRSKKPLETSDLFQLASVTKPLTATAILKLYQEGKLNLSDSVQRFFPDFPYKGITVKLLLTHRSGLPNYMYFCDKVWKDREVPVSNDDVVKLFCKHCPDIYYIPDYRYNYCNTNYALLASIVEKVSGQKYHEYMHEAVFIPAGMKNTYVYDKVRDPKIAGAVTGYLRYGRKAGNSYLNGVVGDKGIYSNVVDLFRFDQALRKGKLLHDSVLRKAYRPLHPDLHMDDNYGLGWRINAQDSADKVVYHTGWWKGFRTYFLQTMGSGKTIVILNNTVRGQFFELEKLLELLDYEDVDKQLAQR